MKQTILRVMIVLVTILLFFLAIRTFPGTTMIGNPDADLYATLTRGGRQMVVQRAHTNPTFVFILTDSSTKQWGFNVSATTFIVTDEDPDRYQRVAVDLTPPEWQRIDAIRQEWCTAPPASMPRREDASYVLGFRCGAQYITKFWYLTPTQLPPEIMRLEQALERAMQQQPPPTPSS